MSGWLRVRVTLDRLVAAVLLVALVPVILVLAWIVRRDDGGPAFIAVDRVGKAGRPLRMWKLRSMQADGPCGRAAGPPLTSADDDRITPIGRRLRAYHLDELPQLYNVVRGEMSLLGPRPEDPEFVEGHEADWAAVLATPPALAGPTQLVVGTWEREVISAAPDGVAYRDEVVPVKLAIDSWYVRRASPRLDLLVVVALAGRLGLGSGLGALRRRVHRQVPESAAVPVEAGGAASHPAIGRC